MRRRTYLFISFFALGLLAPFCVLGDSNNITALIFTTNPQTIAGNTASQAITIQAENSAGTAEKVSETNDVTFNSTSATGQFLNSTGGAVSTMMNTNTASRTFYYEDSVAGTYTITVTIKGKTSGKQFSASQTITISGSSVSDTSNISSTDQSTSSTTSDTSSNGSDEDSSQAYTSQAYIYEGPDNEPFDMSIGRNRLVVVGQPVVFNINLIPESVSSSGMLFHWAFGDGTEWNGSSATHTYDYPGDYIVILNASRYGDQAVAEAKVKVVSADISVSSATDSSILVTNNGDDEINLGGFTLVDDEARFVVPQDTIVASHSSVTVPASVMKTKKFVGSVALYNPSETKLASAVVDGNAAGQDIAIALPAGVSIDELKDKLITALSSSSTKGYEVATEQAASAESSGGRVLLTPPVSKEVAVSTNISASSSVAAVIYSIPRQTGDSVFSGIVSWFGNLFGKK